LEADMERIGETAKALSEQSSTSSSTNSMEQHRAATRCAEILLGCYRSGEASDPELYIRSIVRVLADYPVEVMRRVTDPLTGLPRRVQWLPSASEVARACEEIFGPQRWAAEWDRKARETLAARAHPEMSPAAANRVYEGLKALARELRGEVPAALRKQTEAEHMAELCRQHGVSQAEYDAMPGTTRESMDWDERVAAHSYRKPA
jgi:hypothetical protein